jgi:hypothetical protein
MDCCFKSSDGKNKKNKVKPSQKRRDASGQSVRASDSSDDSETGLVVVAEAELPETVVVVTEAPTPLGKPLNLATDGEEEEEEEGGEQRGIQMGGMHFPIN